MPEPAHSATVSPASETYVARIGGSVIGRSNRARVLREVSPRKSYPPVVYFPLEDVTQDCLKRSDHKSHCPIKGDAGYYDIEAGSRIVANAAWFYPDPLPIVADIKGHIAFYASKVEVTVET